MHNEEDMGRTLSTDKQVPLLGDLPPVTPERKPAKDSQGSPGILGPARLFHPGTWFSKNVSSLSDQAQEEDRAPRRVYLDLPSAVGCSKERWN